MFLDNILCFGSDNIYPFHLNNPLLSNTRLSHGCYAYQAFGTSVELELLLTTVPGEMLHLFIYFIFIFSKKWKKCL